MLDYIGKRDPGVTAPLFLIPTAINYDHVLEDRNLTEELVGKMRGHFLRDEFTEALVEGIEAGALGFSTSNAIAHKTLDGKPTTSECFQQAKRDGGFTHPARYARDHGVRDAFGCSGNTSPKRW